MYMYTVAFEKNVNAKLMSEYMYINVNGENNKVFLTATWRSLLIALLSPVPQYAVAIVNIPALRNRGS